MKRKFSLLRFTNIAILLLVMALSLTGVYGLFWTLHGWVFDLHRLSGWALIAMIPWKVTISAGSLRRGVSANFDRGVMIFVSMLLAMVTLLVSGLGIAWSWHLGSGQAWLRQTLISWHWMLALGLLAPFLLHAWRRWPKPHQVDLLSRRAALKVIGVSMVALVTWGLGEAITRKRVLPGAPRRFTGSREDSSFAGNWFPVTNRPDEGSFRIDAQEWRLEVEDFDGIRRSYLYDELTSMPSTEITATVDCTLGWYSTQSWRGIRLSDLIDLSTRNGALGVRLESESGYAHIFSITEAEEILLATHVGGEILAHEHGFPLRAVVPSRRGWFWVKWLAKVSAVRLPG